MEVVEIREHQTLPQQASWDVIRAPTGKKWDPELWDRDIRIDSFENLKFPDFSEYSGCAEVTHVFLRDSTEPSNEEDVLEDKVHLHLPRNQT